MRKNLIPETIPIFKLLTDWLAALLFIALFLLRQEKGEKKPTQGALYVLLPQSNSVCHGMIATGNHYYFESLRGALPPCVSPGRIAGRSEHLNLNSDLGRNVPISAQMGKAQRTDGRESVHSRPDY